MIVPINRFAESRLICIRQEDSWFHQSWFTHRRMIADLWWMQALGIVWYPLGLN